ncbi:MAG: glycosyltransferase family 4 protein [Proteobacteria bacterium]|nr:glycosyltransferase family 4 protein [Pseudomonadota bacterium]
MSVQERITPVAAEDGSARARPEADGGARPLRVLIIAYACSPALGGEHLLGWEWVSRLSAKHRVTVIAWEQGVRHSESLRPKNLHLIGIDESKFRFLSRMGWPGWYLYYWFWQRAAARLGERLLRQRRFDVVHQLTFHSFRFHGRLARPGNPPFIWGPVAGLESIPLRLFPLVGWRFAFEATRQMSNWISPWLPGVRRTLRYSSAILVSNQDTLRGLKRIHPKGNFVLLPANAVSAEPRGRYEPSGDPLLILGVGEFVRMRAHTLILEALAGIDPASRRRIHFVLVGGGPGKAYLERRTKTLGLEDVVEFTGPVPRTEALRWMSKAHLLVFPSLRDSGGSAICEALALGLPVLALDRAGPAVLLREGGGFLVPARSRKRTVEEIRAALLGFIARRAPLARASKDGMAAAQKLFGWDSRLQTVEELYARVVRDGQAARVAK